MKIGLDLRFIGDDLYSAFTLELVKGLINTDHENNYIIYANTPLEEYTTPNSHVKIVNIQNRSIKEQTTFFKILKSDKNSLMIFFNHFKPVFYVGNYITILPGLKDIYYSDFSNYFYKYSFIYLLEKNLKKSRNILCFDNNTKEELVEKYNIEENRINYLPGFFPYSEKLTHTEDLNLNIRIKYNIKNDYFIYSGGEGVEKNYDKLIQSFHKLKKQGKDIDLVFLGGTISKNLDLRTLIIKLGIQNNIHFIGVIKPAEKILFYRHSLGVIFPSLYEPFPFRLTEPLYFNTPILASDLKNIKNIFSEQISYFSPISINSIYENINKFISNKQKTNNYGIIKEKYTLKNTVENLLEIIR